MKRNFLKLIGRAKYYYFEIARRISEASNIFQEFSDKIFN